MTEPHKLADILDAGLRWLYETEQPELSIQTHHGVLLRAEANRTYSFIPVSALERPVVAVDVTQVDWIDHGPTALKTPANPLKPGELDSLADGLSQRGFDVDATWNGHPGITGSVGLVRTAHPSLLDALGRYRVGCLAHPARSVFCDCGWYGTGSALIVPPRLAPTTPTP